MTGTSVSIALLIVIPGVLGGYVYWSSLPVKRTTLSSIATSTTPSAVETVSTVAPALETTGSNPADATVSARPGMKLYRNDEFGFEFWYPEGWEVKEQTFQSPFSKFNLVAHPTGTHPNFEPLGINITTNDFVSRSYQPYKASAIPTIVGGREGLRYAFEAMTYYTDFVIPLHDDLVIIIGNENKSHLPEFNQVLSTFKFLK